ncbi:hypothetical protein EVAR_52402_1 [Eumeta japonica]|uniref:Uncharacterized protein n=1 Tax=Eumeta variegata TaxID=151549 RepID=A0A4C1Z4D8_EUMVA|nr:hypothetical protein EVAR_52402_1 [Eumeta japonica]
MPTPDNDNLASRSFRVVATCSDVWDPLFIRWRWAREFMTLLTGWVCVRYGLLFKGQSDDYYMTSFRTRSRPHGHGDIFPVDLATPGQVGSSIAHFAQYTRGRVGGATISAIGISCTGDGRALGRKRWFVRIIQLNGSPRAHERANGRGSCGFTTITRRDAPLSV